MDKFTVKKIATICDAEIFCGEESTQCSTFTNNTRAIQKGDTYIGIKGAKFDGNLLYKEAFTNGAICAILEKDSFVEDKDYFYDKSIILVDSTLEALKKLAEYKRNNSSAYFVGVTGSVGKTSTRDMIYSVLNQKYKTLKTEGNFNSKIGLPLTLMRLEDEEAAVIEMGMNAALEIDYLSKITKPHIGVITNVGTAHIGELGSRENILKAKLEILNGMDEDGKLIINNDNDLLHEYALKYPERLITIGIEAESDFQAIDITLSSTNSTFKILYKNKMYDIICPVPGRAFVYNSLIAFAVGMLLQIPEEEIKKGIENFQLTKNRTDIFTIEPNITIINDVYNASVDSMQSSLEILKNIKATRRIAVLGSMLELGDYSKELHEQVGTFVVKNNVDILITLGSEAKWIQEKAIELGMKEVYTFSSNLDAISFLKQNIKANDAILLKASNSLKFIEIVDALKKE